MKKAMILLTALLIFCLSAACSKQPVTGGDTTIESKVTSTASISASVASAAPTTSAASTAPVTSAASALNSAAAKKSSSVNSSKAVPSSAANISQKKPAETTECIHDYVKKVIAPTCTAQGYTLHTCKKCGKSYRDSYTAPRHEYGKYLCERCGRPDPSTPVYSLSAWLEKNGTLAGNGIYSAIHYEKDGATYNISTNIYTNSEIYFDCEKGGEIFRIFLDNTDQCDIFYSYSGLSGSAGPKKSAVSSSFPLKLNHFENNGNVICSKEEFTAQMLSKIDGFMKIIQDKLLYPRTGLKLKDFGFTAY